MALRYGRYNCSDAVPLTVVSSCFPEKTWPMTDFEAKRDTAKTAKGSSPEALPARRSPNEAVATMTEGNDGNDGEKWEAIKRDPQTGEGAGRLGKVLLAA